MTVYLSFELQPRTGKEKTARGIVRAARSGEPLGEIKWFGRWRQYTFFPASGTTFNPDCLAQIAAQCLSMTQAHRARRAARGAA